MSCEELLKYLSSISDVQDLRSSFIAICVFNNFLTYSSIMLNIVTIYAIRKTSSLPKTLKTFLLSLAVSDVGVGLFVQPFILHLWSTGYKSTILAVAPINWIFTIICLLFGLASFLGVLVLNVDRFLAVHLHPRYQELVTHKRVVAVVISVWVLSAFVSALTLCNLYDTQRLILNVAGLIDFLLSVVICSRIYLTVRRHKNQIQALQVQQGEQTGEMANFVRFQVFLVFLVCYLPYFISLDAIKINGPSITMKLFFLFSFTLVFLNSSVNPVIYCWKMRHIRHAIMDILRNMSWNRNQPAVLS